MLRSRPRWGSASSRQRKGKCNGRKISVFTAHSKHRKGAAKLRKLDFAEREQGHVKGVIWRHYPRSGRGAPLAKVQFPNFYRFKKDNELMVISEGTYTGQFIYAGKSAQLTVGNILPLSSIPEGTVVCNIEGKAGDRGSFAKCSGNYAIIVTHDEDRGTTKVRMPSGGKKTLSNKCRAMVGIVAGGGRTDKPMLKAGRAYHKYRVKRNEWPSARAGNEPRRASTRRRQPPTTGHPSTSNRLSSAGQKVGLMPRGVRAACAASRRLGRTRTRLLRVFVLCAARHTACFVASGAPPSSGRGAPPRARMSEPAARARASLVPLVPFWSCSAAGAPVAGVPPPPPPPRFEGRSRSVAPLCGREARASAYA